ncbi:MAG TPA: hypothetical protein VKB93_13425 [Thermoanaerobaculia bacterium]|nr:hypothetical protein [Thermoanaerobaculia bacterium]
MSTFPDVPQSHADAARKLTLAVRQLRESVPGLVLLPNERLKELITPASVSDEFLETVVSGVEATSELASASKIVVADVHDVIAFSRAYASPIDEVELFWRMLRHTVIVRRARIGQDALKAFAIAKNLNRPRKSDLLVPHIEAMRRTLGRTRRKQAAPEPEAA